MLELKYVRLFLLKGCFYLGVICKFSSMNKLCCVILLILNYRNCDAQNLIPNPNFEDTIYCPTSANQVVALQHWLPLLESPDYFYRFGCGTLASTFSVPSNFCGYQNAFSGNGYVGMICYYASVSPEAREYIGTQLNSTLNIGQKYFISFNLSLSGGNGFLTGTNKFGCKLSTIPFVIDGVTSNNQATFFTDSIITDTLNWVKIRGSFIADSAYDYIAFGNFFVDSLTANIILECLQFTNLIIILMMCVYL